MTAFLGVNGSLLSMGIAHGKNGATRKDRTTSDWMTGNRNKFREGQRHTNDKCNRFAVAVSTHLRHCKAAPLWKWPKRSCSHTFTWGAVQARPAWHRVIASHSKGSCSLLGLPLYTRVSHAFQQVEKGQETMSKGSMGSMHSCHLNPPYPSFTRMSTARTHSHTHLLSQSPGMPQTRHVLEHRRGLGKCSIFFQLCPWKVSKVLSNWRHTVPIMLLHQGCPWESQQKGPSWPHLQHAVMFMAWTETFLVRAKCQVCILAGFLKENFPDQTSDLGKPSLQQIHKIESNPSRVMGFAVSETYRLQRQDFESCVLQG